MTQKLTWETAPQSLTTRQAAELLGIKRLHTVADLCKNGEIPATKTGWTWRIDRDALRAKFAANLSHGTPGLAEKLGEIELTLATLAAMHRGEAVAEALAKAHAATLEAYQVAKEEET